MSSLATAIASACAKARRCRSNLCSAADFALLNGKPKAATAMREATRMLENHRGSDEEQRLSEAVSSGVCYVFISSHAFCSVKDF